MMGTETQLILLVAAALLTIGFCAGWVTRGLRDRSWAAWASAQTMARNTTAKEDARARTSAGALEY